MNRRVVIRDMRGGLRGMEVDKLKLSRDDESGEGKCFLKIIQAWAAKHGF
jgi:hypothetical protein